MSTDVIFSYGYNCYNRHGSITEEIKKEIKETFDLFDIDGKGTISCNEILRVFRLLGMDNSFSSTEELLKRVDKEGKGHVSYTEFETYIKQSGFLKCLPDADETDTREAFQLLDMDGNGFIERDELALFLKRLRGKNLNLEDIDDMIREADIDGDGRINFLEFKTRLSENF